MPTYRHRIDNAYKHADLQTPYR